MRTFAPGKLVVLGEYAVLDDAPCLAVAVDSGVGCEVSAADELLISTPTGDDRFVRAALTSLGSPPGRYAFHDVRPLDLPGKPGLGGSAASVVAALLAGGCPEERLLGEALRIHHTVQGSGSGIDVAAASTGGAIHFEAGRVRPVDVPMPVVVYSGTSARTGPRVHQYRAWAGRQAFVEATHALVDRFDSAPLDTVRDAWRLLTEMAARAGIAYRTPGIDTLVELAEQHGGAAKPSGAGGGDVVTAWFSGPPSEQAFREAATALGFHVLDVQMSGGPSRER